MDTKNKSKLQKAVYNCQTRIQRRRTGCIPKPSPGLTFCVWFCSLWLQRAYTFHCVQHAMFTLFVLRFALTKTHTLCERSHENNPKTLSISPPYPVYHSFHKSGYNLIQAFARTITQFYLHFCGFFPKLSSKYHHFFSSTNHKDYFIVHMVTSLQIHHFVTSDVLAVPSKASQNEKAGCIFVNEFRSLETI